MALNYAVEVTLMVDVDVMGLMDRNDEQKEVPL